MNGTTTDCPYYRGVLISQVHLYTFILQWLTVLIIEVSLFHKFIYTHLYCNGTTTDCPYYRGVLISQVHLYTFILQWLTVLIIEVSLLHSIHNSRFDCSN